MKTEIRGFINPSGSNDMDEMHYIVDIPNANSDEWISIEYFKTKKEAIEFAQERFGADNKGNICLISSI